MAEIMEPAWLAPAVTGSLSLLYERYRQLHAGANPNGALIKASDLQYC